MTSHHDLDLEELSQYKVDSRREIVALLRRVQEANQLVTMLIDGGPESVVTSILRVDDASGMVIVDEAPSAATNQCVVRSDSVLLETSLDSIRILSFISNVEACSYDGSTALRFAIPENLIRLQRREHYRVPTPVVNPLRCTFQFLDEATGSVTRAALPLHNISGGGIAVIDENKQLDNTVGRIYRDCKIELPGGGPVISSLEIRGSLDYTLPNGKSVRRLGCQFIDLTGSMLAAVQRYITKLERERNAKATGLR